MSTHLLMDLKWEIGCSLYVLRQRTALSGPQLPTDRLSTPLRPSARGSESVTKTGARGCSPIHPQLSSMMKWGNSPCPVWLSGPIQTFATDVWRVTFGPTVCPGRMHREGTRFPWVRVGWGRALWRADSRRAQGPQDRPGSKSILCSDRFGEKLVPVPDHLVSQAELHRHAGTML